MNAQNEAEASAILTVERTKVDGYGVLEAGTYEVEMPADYEPALVTAEDIILDPMIRILGEVQS